MRPSVPVTLEPGSERGVPWGRDLYTFVTSAAGHMMRTLQKPRKNRPSKRQVNHRRFLHNMIQRKFADIEAANHRLASALYYKEEEKNAPSVSSEKPEMSVQSDNAFQTNPPPRPEKCSPHRDADGVSKPANDASVGPHQTEASDKKQLNPGHLWRRHPKSPSTTCTPRRNNLSTGRQKRANENPAVAKGKDCDREAAAFQPESYEDDNQIKPPSSLSEAQTAPQDSGFTPNKDTSPSFSPALSPLSIDSCDFSIQMFTDISACTHSQRSIADIAESQWADIMDLFSGGNGDKESCTDMEAYLERFCLCQGDAGQDVGTEELPFPDQSHSLFNNRCESEDPCCERGEYSGYSCQGDQSTSQAGNTQFHNFTPARSDMPIRYHYGMSDLQPHQSPQEESHCLLGGCENHLHFTPFEGVAQSFSAPVHHPEHRSIPTPPRDDDWLFTDILKDAREPPGC